MTTDTFENGTNSENPSQIPTFTLKALDDLKEQAKQRYRLRWFALMIGFFDGAYDIVALSGLPKTFVIAIYAAETLLFMMAPPAAILTFLIFLGTAVVYGAIQARSAYLEEEKAAAIEKKIIEQAIQITDTYEEVERTFSVTEKIRAFIAATKPEEISPEPKLPSADFAPTPWDKFVDAADLWSRRLRNDTTSSTVLILMVCGILSLPLTWPIAIALLVTVAIQFIPRILNHFVIDKPRKSNTESLKTYIAQTQNKIDILQNVLENNPLLLTLSAHQKLLAKSANADSISSSLKSESSTSSLSSDKLSVTSTLEKDYSSKDYSSKDYSSIGFTALRDNPERLLRNKRGSQLAYFLGFTNGALHMLAWPTLIVLLVFSFIPVVNIGLAGVIAGIVCISAFFAAAVGVGMILGARWQKKEHEEQFKEKEEINHAIHNATIKEEIVDSINKTREEEEKLPFLGKLNEIFEKCKSNIIKSVPLENHTSVIPALENKYLSLSSSYKSCIHDEKQLQDTLLKSTPESSLENKSADFLSRLAINSSKFFRKTRDYFGVTETFLMLICILAGIGLGPLAFGASLAITGIVITAHIYKENAIDDIRKKNFETLETTNTYFNTERNSYRTKKQILASQKKELENQLETFTKTTIQGENIPTKKPTTGFISPVAPSTNLPPLNFPYTPEQYDSYTYSVG